MSADIWDVVDATIVARGTTRPEFFEAAVLAEIDRGDEQCRPSSPTPPATTGPLSLWEKSEGGQGGVDCVGGKEWD